MNDTRIYNHPARAKMDHLIQLGRASGFVPMQSMRSANGGNWDRERKWNQDRTWTKITYPLETRFPTNIKKTKIGIGLEQGTWIEQGPKSHSFPIPILKQTEKSGSGERKELEPSKFQVTVSFRNPNPIRKTKRKGT
jgi:hypothetical protein